MPPTVPPGLSRKMFALFGEAGIGGEKDRARRLAVCEFITWHRITSTNQLTQPDVQAIVGTLEYWKSCAALQYRCQRIGDKLLEGTHA